MKAAKCFKCKKKITFSTGICGPKSFTRDKRDNDGLDIFVCGCFNPTRFKIDMKDYLKNRNKKNFFLKTVPYNYDYSDGMDKNPKIKKVSPIKKIFDWLT